MIRFFEKLNIVQVNPGKKMEVTEDEVFQKNAIQRKQCMRYTLSPYDSERNCTACG